MEDTVGSAVHGQTSIRDKRTLTGWMAMHWASSIQDIIAYCSIPSVYQRDYLHMHLPIHNDVTMIMFAFAFVPLQAGLLPFDALMSSFAETCSLSGTITSSCICEHQGFQETIS